MCILAGDVISEIKGKHFSLELWQTYVILDGKHLHWVFPIKVNILDGYYINIKWFNTYVLTINVFDEENHILSLHSERLSFMTLSQ